MRYEDVPKLTTWQLDSVALATGGGGGRVAALTAAFSNAKVGNIVAPPPLAPPTSAPRGDLKPIDDLVALYEQAWSPMAKTNILVDLNRAIVTWEGAHNGAQPLAMVALKEVVARRLRGVTPLGGKYTRALCIGWRVGCNYQRSTNTVHPINRMGLNTDYFRHSDDDRADMERKCADMMKAITAAAAAVRHPMVGDNDSTLKIFMAPEFYFRGRNGAYSPEIVADILPKMQALGTAKGYGDWLFVFGTAVAAIDQEVTFCTTCGYGNSTIRFDRDPLNRAKTIAKCSRDTGLGPAHVIDTGSVGAEVQNVALIQHGGDTHLVAKEYVSGIDYIGGEVTVHPGQAGEMSLPVKPPEGSHDGGIRSKFDDERMGGCVLTVDGLTIGLEVCLDHNESLTPGLGRAYPFSGAIQILLIPSFGMDIGTGLYCRHGGVVFNVDGRGQGSSELVVKGRLTGIRCWKAGVAGGRGGLDIWSPQAIPR